MFSLPAHNKQEGSERRRREEEEEEEEGMEDGDRQTQWGWTEIAAARQEQEGQRQIILIKSGWFDRKAAGVSQSAGAGAFQIQASAHIYVSDPSA